MLIRKTAASVASRCPWCAAHAPRPGPSVAPSASASTFRARLSRRSQSTSATAQPPRLRFAPSPTGSLHLGGLRTALFNHLYARKHGGEWILRIEDTDRKRHVEGSTTALQECLRWAGLQPGLGPESQGVHKLGPFVQSKRTGHYRDAVKTLLLEGHAYRDFRSIEEREEERNLAQQGDRNARAVRREEYVPPSEQEAARLIEAQQPFVVRLRMTQQVRTHEDLVYGKLTFNKDESAEDPILLKSDGMPTYHLANVVDDSLMGITHVLRGEEWIPSLPIHLQLYEALGRQAPHFAHLPLLITPDGSKLSKRSGNGAIVQEYIQQDYEPEALLNYVALLGCNWKGDTQGGAAGGSEVMTMQELVGKFELERVTHSRAALNPAKLAFLNRKHMQLKVDAILHPVAPGKQRLKGKGNAALTGTSLAKQQSKQSPTKRGVDSASAAHMLERFRQHLKNCYDEAKISFTTHAKLAQICRLYGEKADTLQGIAEHAKVLFERPVWKSESVLRFVGPQSYIHILSMASTQLSSAPVSTVATAEDALFIIAEKALKNLFRPASLLGEPEMNKKTVSVALRHALTGELSGPALKELLALMNSKEILERLEHASTAMREEVGAQQEPHGKQVGETQLERQLDACKKKYARLLANATSPHDRVRLEVDQAREEAHIREWETTRRLTRTRVAIEPKSTRRMKF